MPQHDLNEQASKCNEFMNVKNRLCFMFQIYNEPREKRIEMFYMYKL